MRYNETIEDDMIAMEAAAQELGCGQEHFVAHPLIIRDCDVETCNFSEMIPLFQELFDPAPAHLTALMGRMKNLLRLGSAGEAKCGRGRSSRFTKAQVWELLIITEMGQLGVSPQKAIDTFRANEDRFRNGWDWVVEIILSHTRSSGIKIDCFSLNGAAKRHLTALWEGVGG